ncbi:NPCBM/NEW2 domain-containing protein [Actinoallomurus rhizosphaericola]|uniref:NPCBM/NEW2 domain-containing protein n=1 Tax=Actinoallomurus rhizosphaericola TaxID=2952536 RepID=UPI0020905549|nr:NPCBM/NEW2 domain-containing protein [Actinoallomurus rhizosphaericola]MCO5992097.1 NPCBM/NEW2 domain-containing protein [Actinoallomurus rhizosphaericola]
MRTVRSLTSAVTALAMGAATAVALALSSAPPAAALDNGLALIPQMGFNNWNATHCGADFNEDMVKGIADLFVSSGLKDAGYQYVNLDDCWAEQNRDANGDLVPNKTRFPSGIRALADYVHSKGLKLGIYSSAGTLTCAGTMPGALGHEEQDARTWASWGVDYLKYDNCNNQGVDAIQRYTKMRDALKATGRPILYSICEWGSNQPWLWGKDVGNSWRTTGDISDSYSSMLSIVHQNMALTQYAGPGHWNDPDMLEVGNGGMTGTEYRSHFSLWSIMAAPLLIGTDLRKASAATMSILENKEVIAVDQDRLGVQGAPISTDGGRDVFVKRLANGDRAVALFNETDSPQRIATSASAVGLPGAAAYTVRDLWAHTTHETAGVIAATVPAHGTVMYRVAADRSWAEYPPAVDLGIGLPVAYPGALPILQPGADATVTTTVANAGRRPALRVNATLTGPGGWTVEATSARTRPALPTGSSLTTNWTVRPPADTAPGTYTLTARAGTADETLTEDVQVTVRKLDAPPSGTSYLSDLTWVRSTNGWGPVEKDRSNGETGDADGNPITINGVVYQKGLGAHAPSTVEYYLAKRCTAVSADVGVDDEKTQNGSVTFEIWADGTKVADSGLLTTADPAKHLTADVSGAQFVRLIVTDGGNGVDSDHADWADAKVTCA